MTFSILGLCPHTGRLGMAVTSSSPAVASRCAHARPGVGVAASQNVTDPRLGPLLLDAMARGASAEEAVSTVAATAPHAGYRQLAAVSSSGSSAAWSGDRTLGLHGTRTGDGWAVAGNLLASREVLDAIANTFQASTAAELEDRLLEALAAGLDAGGEQGPLGSAGVVVVDGDVQWPVTDLRIDWRAEDGPGPIQELAFLWTRWAPERDDYVTRGLDPRSARSFGVPGDPRNTT